MDGGMVRGAPEGAALPSLQQTLLKKENVKNSQETVV